MTTDNKTFTLIRSGQWYDENYAEQISKFKTHKMVKGIQGIIVPHAGLKYSGQTANYAYSMIEWNKIEKVFIFCTNHKNNKTISPLFSKIFVGKKIFEVDRNIISELDSMKISIPDSGNDFYEEHSFEMQLPFLSYYGKNIKSVVPFLIGNKNIEYLAKHISKYFDKKTIFISTTDFTHYGKRFGNLPLDQEKVTIIEKKDKKAIDGIITKSREKVSKYNKSVCGKNVLEFTILLSDELNLKAGVVDYSTSFTHVKNEYDDSIVTYSSIAYVPQTKNLFEYWKKNIFENNSVDIFSLAEHDLVNIPRLTMIIIDKLNLVNATTSEKIKQVIKFTKSSSYEFKPHGIFVTFNVKKELQGCIGTFYNKMNKNLIEVIIKYTILTVFEDSRFISPLTKKNNYENLYGKNSGYEFKVNYLEKSFPIDKNNFFNEYIPDRHGIILKNKNNSATFLPSVMREQGWIKNKLSTKENKKYFFDKTFESLLRKMNDNSSIDKIFKDQDYQIFLYKGYEYSDISESAESIFFMYEKVLKKKIVSKNKTYFLPQKKINHPIIENNHRNQNQLLKKNL